MRRVAVQAALALVAIGAASLAFEAQRRLSNARELNDAVQAAGQQSETSSEQGIDSARVLLADAVRLSGAGETDAAERAFAAVLRRGREPALLRDARFGLANLYLRAGLQPDLDPARAAALLEIAKQRYRDHLRDAPGDRDARWNLELALRSAPESEDAVEPSAAQPVKRVNVIVPDFAPTDLP